MANVVLKAVLCAAHWRKHHKLSLNSQVMHVLYTVCQCVILCMQLRVTTSVSQSVFIPREKNGETSLVLSNCLILRVTSVNCPLVLQV